MQSRPNPPCRHVEPPGNMGAFGADFFSRRPISRPPSPVVTGGTMSTPNLAPRESRGARWEAAGGDGKPSPSPGDLLVCAFNALRDELVSTLMFILGNRDDAQDAA